MLYIYQAGIVMNAFLRDRQTDRETHREREGERADLKSSNAIFSLYTKPRQCQVWSCYIKALNSSWLQSGFEHDNDLSKSSKMKMNDVFVFLKK